MRIYDTTVIIIFFVVIVTERGEKHTEIYAVFLGSSSIILRYHSSFLGIFSHEKSILFYSFLDIAYLFFRTYRKRKRKVKNKMEQKPQHTNRLINEKSPYLLVRNRNLMENGEKVFKKGCLILLILK